MGNVKWRTGLSAKIERIEVERETESCVWFTPRWSSGGPVKHLKRTSYENYFDTWREAHAHLLAHATASLECARLHLAEAQVRHGNIVGMKPPAGEE